MHNHDNDNQQQKDSINRNQDFVKMCWETHNLYEQCGHINVDLQECLLHVIVFRGEQWMLRTCQNIITVKDGVFTVRTNPRIASLVDIDGLCPKCMLEGANMIHASTPVATHVRDTYDTAYLSLESRPVQGLVKQVLSVVNGLFNEVPTAEQIQNSNLANHEVRQPPQATASAVDIGEERIGGHSEEDSVRNIEPERHISSPFRFQQGDRGTPGSLEPDLKKAEENNSNTGILRKISGSDQRVCAAEHPGDQDRAKYTDTVQNAAQEDQESDTQSFVCSGKGEEPAEQYMTVKHSGGEARHVDQMVKKVIPTTPPKRKVDFIFENVSPTVVHDDMRHPQDDDCNGGKLEPDIVSEDEMAKANIQTLPLTPKAQVKKDGSHTGLAEHCASVGRPHGTHNGRGIPDELFNGTIHQGRDTTERIAKWRQISATHTIIQSPCKTSSTDQDESTHLSSAFTTIAAPYETPRTTTGTTIAPAYETPRTTIPPEDAGTLNRLEHKAQTFKMISPDASRQDQNNFLYGPRTGSNKKDTNPRPSCIPPGADIIHSNPMSPLFQRPGAVSPAKADTPERKQAVRAFKLAQNAEKQRDIDKLGAGNLIRVNSVVSSTLAPYNTIRAQYLDGKVGEMMVAESKHNKHSKHSRHTKESGKRKQAYPKRQEQYDEFWKKYYAIGTDSKALKEAGPRIEVTGSADVGISNRHHVEIAQDDTHVVGEQNRGGGWNGDAKQIRTTTRIPGQPTNQQSPPPPIPERTNPGSANQERFDHRAAIQETDIRLFGAPIPSDIPSSNDNATPPARKPLQYPSNDEPWPILGSAAPTNPSTNTQSDWNSRISNSTGTSDPSPNTTNTISITNTSLRNKPRPRAESQGSKSTIPAIFSLIKKSVPKMPWGVASEKSKVIKKVKTKTVDKKGHGFDDHDQQRLKRGDVEVAQKTPAQPVNSVYNPARIVARGGGGGGGGKARMLADSMRYRDDGAMGGSYVDVDVDVDEEDYISRLGSRARGAVRGGSSTGAFSPGFDELEASIWG